MFGPFGRLKVKKKNRRIPSDVRVAHKENR